jgi:hypothetical protein
MSASTTSAMGLCSLPAATAAQDRDYGLQRIAAGLQAAKFGHHYSSVFANRQERPLTHRFIFAAFEPALFARR